MGSKKSKKFIPLIVVSLFVLTIFSCPTLTKASDSYEAILLWQTNSFSPSNYLGKKLPINGSVISLYLLLKKNTRLVDIGSYPVLWYIDNEFQRGGIGEAENSFIVRKTSGDFYNIRAEIKVPEGTVEKTINIPIISPRVVIDDSFYLTSNEKKVIFSAIPYFFNVKSISELNFSWLVDTTGQGYKTSGDNQLLVNTGDMPKNEEIKIVVAVQNKNSTIEMASRSKNIYAK